MPETEQNGAVEAVESNYETYLKQRSLNEALVNVAMLSGLWLAAGAATLGIAAMVRPKADVVGMDTAGREHPVVVMPIQAVERKK